MIFCVEMTTEDPSLQSAAVTSAQTEPSILTTTAVNVPVPAWSDPLAKDDAVIENKSEFYSMLEDFTETCDDELTKFVTESCSKWKEIKNISALNVALLGNICMKLIATF